jgi:tetratricopeptide (TPR) repeat protein
MYGRPAHSTGDRLLKDKSASGTQRSGRKETIWTMIGPNGRFPTVRNIAGSHRSLVVHLAWKPVLIPVRTRDLHSAVVGLLAAVLLSISCTKASFAQQQAALTPAQEHERRAQAFLAQKQPQLAIPEFQAALVTDPNNLDDRANLGVLQFFQQDYAGAAPNLRQAVAAKPDLSKIRALLGLAEKYLGQTTEARADLEAALAQLTEPPIRIQTGLALIEIDAASQDFYKAAAVVAILRQIAPTDPRVIYTAYRIAADQAAEAMLSLSLVAPDSAQMHQAMGHELERARDIPGMIANLRKAAELDPALPGIHYELAQALQLAAEPKVRAEAEAEYKLALQQNPSDAHSAAALGDLAAARSDLAAASGFYQRALKIDSQMPDAAIGLAYIKTQQDDYLGAVPLLEAAIAADPTNTLAHYRLSAVYRKLGRQADARRELEAYQRYKNVTDKMRAIYNEMRQTAPGEAQSADEKVVQ